MPKITNRLEEIKYWNQKKREYAIKASKKQKVTPVLKRKQYKIKKTQIRKKSKKQEARDRQYYRNRKIWFQNPENQLCKIRMIQKCIDKVQPAVDVHHSEGRIGSKLLDEKTWVPCCRGCHRYAEENPKEAYEKGVSKSRHKIN